MIESLVKSFREHVDFIKTDTIMYDKMQIGFEFIQSLEDWFGFE